MEEQWYVDRAKLRELINQHPEWSKRQLAEAVGCSISWVKKWRRRFREADPDDDSVLYGLSRARHNPPPSIAEEVVERVLEIRDNPPENLNRTPGPKTILYYLHRDEQLKVSGLYLPRSTSTIWKILDQHGRIWRPPTIEHVSVERPDPLSAWEIDFKDVSTVPPDPDGKQQHVVEVLNVVDTGTSILVEALPHENYNAENTILAMTRVFLVQGLPDIVRLDRDTRFVGGWSGQDFPAAFSRFLFCLGVQPDVCPPRRPDLKPFVERYNKTFEYECLRIHRPTDVGQTCEVTEVFKYHYNSERPNQAVTCGNQPPYEAFPHLPQLPSLPETIDPDRWLRAMHNECFKRRVTSNGSVKVNRHGYYIRRSLKGRYVVLRVDAQAQQFVVELDGLIIKRIPIKGLHDQSMEFQAYLKVICSEARSEWKRSRYHQARRRGAR